MGDTGVGKGITSEVRNSLGSSDLNLLALSVISGGFLLLLLGPSTFAKSHFSALQFDYLVISTDLDLFKLH